MAGLIRHNASTHQDANDGLRKGHQHIGRHESDLHSTANNLGAVWSGSAYEQFQYKHQTLMKHVALLKDHCDRLNSLRENAHTDIVGADNKVAGMWNA
ncbi:hypothetical protein KO481_15735 [Nocardia sp. NEAU-G5]|uniref:ESAT-6-like protein n=1 Tax=Nocardia albiluteola TaxID=2842303 RepID=A0ABS6B153_9NOCA|nr:WXG100 family type VII secretion target [Nocardia albiluteola]MBU3062969.1 hypothetical protein [Nocardia albiluteola]